MYVCMCTCMHAYVCTVGGHLARAGGGISRVISYDLILLSLSLEELYTIF